MFRSRSSSVVVAVGLALAATACVDQGQPGVRTDSAQADIVFGVASAQDAELADLVVPPPPATADPAQTIGHALRVPFRNKLPNRFSNVAFTVSGNDVSAGACPSAPLGAAPEELAQRNATEPPQPGLYRYRVQGTRTMTVNGQEIPAQIDSFQPRIVQNVEEVSDTSWRFELVEPLGDGTRITTWIVDTDPQEVPNPTSEDTDGDGVPDGRGISPPYVGQNPVRAGQPDRGVAIESIEDFDADGNPAGSFDAVPALLQLPLPVLPGESFQSIAVDRQGQFMEVDAQVGDRETVDACGELVDGWMVSQSVTTAQSIDSNVTDRDYIFSTPLGGLLVSEHVKGSMVDPASGVSTSFDLTYSIGQVEPSPVPGEDT